MQPTAKLQIQWIPESCGGRRYPPFVGYRPTMRWQKFVAESLEFASDVTLLDIQIDNSTLTGLAIVEFTQSDLIPEEWLSEGEYIELLEGYRVVGVGVIIDLNVRGTSKM